MFFCFLLKCFKANTSLCCRNRVYVTHLRGSCGIDLEEKMWRTSVFVGWNEWPFLLFFSQKCNEPKCLWSFYWIKNIL